MKSKQQKMILFKETLYLLLEGERAAVVIIEVLDQLVGFTLRG
jgi:hypothetical protein